jgi:drug/metabolite transporter (DMT)-like permease
VRPPPEDTDAEQRHVTGGYGCRGSGLHLQFGRADAAGRHVRKHHGTRPVRVRPAGPGRPGAGRTQAGHAAAAVSESLAGPAFGLFLAGDLILWSHAITAIGAGLGTVVTNLQVLIISLLARLILGERPRRSLVLASPVMLAGLALVGGLGGLGGSGAYGTDPSLGVVYGIGVAILYAIYILILRQATSAGGTRPGRDAGGTRTAVAGVLFEATVGATVGSAAGGFAWHDFHLGHAWPTLGWLVLLALTSQVLGWLLITMSMPRLPAGMIGALLLVQPAGSVALSYVILGERPSALQLLGVALVLAGLLIAVSVGTATSPADAAAPAGAARAAGQVS